MVINGSNPWVLSGLDNFAVIEPYWLNSHGVYFYVDPKTPLFIDQNNLNQDQVCFISKVKDVYINRQRLLMNITIVYANDPKTAHRHAVRTFLGKPTGYPNEKMIREPIWTTWAKYKVDIDDKTVLDFAKDIFAHGYKGQLEIDDDWEKCYGAQVFSDKKFSQINNTVKELHDMGFRVTLWTHPFVNEGCYNEPIGIEKGYFVKNTTGSTKAVWWNGVGHQIDYTNPEAQQWVLDRLNTLKNEQGIDSFKFDAGETDWANQPAVYENVDLELVPNIHTSNYVRFCAQLGDLIEVRAAWRTQDLPTFVRMLDKDSVWNENNGLKSLITTLLQMNMNGYGMVLPDMIGGNGYNGVLPTAELLVRWTQANTFMPSMQFSFLPWEVKSEKFNTETIIKKFVDLHEKYSDEIVNAMEAAVDSGEPVNPPIWWIDPLNEDTYKVDDQYLLGSRILVAPVIVEGAISRDIIIPDGTWKDGNSGNIIQGPTKIRDYNAPIDILPYFIKQ